MKLSFLIGILCLSSSLGYSYENQRSLESECLTLDGDQGNSQQKQLPKVCDANLVDIESVIPGVSLELKYATEDNFTGQIVYRFTRCLLICEAALRLREVQKELNAMGLGIKIWDGYRPIAAQWKFWELVPDERYVSDPKKGGRHTRGTAVDLTLITTEGLEMPMPSDFDDFSEKAHRDYMGASSEEIENRQLLQTVMERHGFCGLSTEWWHFDLVDWENYPPLDIDPSLY